MPNSFYNHSSGVPATQTRGSSLNIRAELDLIEDGFDAVETAMDLKAPKASPTFTGTLAAAAATLSGLLTGAAATFSGLLTINGGQIKFPATQVPSSDANTLDDYEEGTWTPVIIGDGSAGTYTPGTTLGHYVKIGKLVYIKCSVSWTGHTGSGSIIIQGLPFAPLSTGACPAHLSSDISADYYFSVSSASQIILTNVPISSSGSVQCSGSYIANA